MSSRARMGPTVAASSDTLDGAGQFPRVRATGAPKRAWAAASRRSHARDMNRPPPTASPCTIAIVGLAIPWIRRRTRPIRAS